MTARLHHIAPLVLALLAAAPQGAAAQTTESIPIQRGTATVAPMAPAPAATPGSDVFGPAPQRGMATIAPGPSSPPAGIPQQMPPAAAACIKEFVPLRDAAQKGASLIDAAAKRKVPREELCKLFNNFVAAETKVVKFMEQNSSSCGVPADAISNMKKGHARALTMRQQVCSEAPVGGPPGKPPGPSLSDALGGPRLPAPTASSSGLGTWDTLTGTPLRR